MGSKSSTTRQRSFRMLMGTVLWRGIVFIAAVLLVAWIAIWVDTETNSRTLRITEITPAFQVRIHWISVEFGRLLLSFDTFQVDEIPTRSKPGVEHEWRRFVRRPQNNWSYSDRSNTAHERVLLGVAWAANVIRPGDWQLSIPCLYVCLALMVLPAIEIPSTLR